MEKQTINDLSLLNATNIDNVQLSNMTINTKFVDSAQMKIALDKIDNNSRLLSTILSQMDEKTDFLMSTKDIINQMIVTDLSTWYYDSDAILHPYPSIICALQDNTKFEGRINLMTDITLDDEPINFSSNGCANPRKITIDCHNHTISCMLSTCIVLSYGTEMTIQDGKMILPKVFDTPSIKEEKIKIWQGSLHLKNIKIDGDAGKNDSTWNYVLFKMTQSKAELENRIGRSTLDLDKDCEVNVYNANRGESIILSMSPYTQYKNNSFWDKYGTAEEIMPTINIDCIVKIKCSDESHVYPNVIGGTGSDKLDTIINIKPHARLYAQSHGLYLGNKGTINIEGDPIIVGGTGICMRSGTLNIPKDANPTIIGTGLSSVYDPLHTMRAGGSDAGSNLNLGHALLLENNGISYGGSPVSANIQAGTFISYNNTAIGSYSIATLCCSSELEAAGLADGVYKVNAGGGIMTDYSVSAEYVNSKGKIISLDNVYFYNRITGFADGIYTAKRESQLPYDYLSGFNPDYKISKITNKSASINAVRFEDGTSFDVTDESGLRSAVKQILNLLGASEVTDDNEIAGTPIPGGGGLLDTTPPTTTKPLIQNLNPVTTPEILEPDIGDDAPEKGSVEC